jgi:hypothetical protein
VLLASLISLVAISSAARETAAQKKSSLGNQALELHSQELIPIYSGTQVTLRALEGNLSQPLSLASGDFDEDGIPDLAVGFSSSGGGILAIHKGRSEALYSHPDSAVRHPESAAGRTRSGSAVLPFSQTARCFELPESPQFLFAGDFNGDGHVDVATGKVGSKSIRILPGDGMGGFGPSIVISLPGVLTTLTAGEINRNDDLGDLVAGVTGPEGSAVVIFESPAGAASAKAEIFPVASEVRALALGRLNSDHLSALAVAAGQDLLVIDGRDRHFPKEGSVSPVPASLVSRRNLGFTVSSLAAADFSGVGRTDIALLAEDGSVYIAERLESEKWENASVRKVADGAVPAKGAAASQLTATRLFGLPSDDLLLLDRNARRLRVLTAEPPPVGSQVPRPPAPPRVVDIADFDFEPNALLSMRLNRDALADLVILKTSNKALTILTTAPKAVVTVNSNDDSNNRDKSLTLREAILVANGTLPLSSLTALEQAQISGTPAHGGLTEIRFRIPGSGGPLVIGPTSALPSITGQVLLDGTTQPGFKGAPVIEINGFAAGSGVTGLNVTAGYSSIRGLSITRFDGPGIQLKTTGGNILEGNYIGVGPDGNSGRGNNREGVLIDQTAGNIIGGSVPPARNVISSNLSHGVRIRGAGASSNLILGNFIGTNATGETALPNQENGVFIDDAPYNTVGGGGAGNVISGNNGNGIRIFNFNANGNRIQGNFIGTNVAGTAAVGNAGNGIEVKYGSNTTIGGITRRARNLISGNRSSGVMVDTFTAGAIVQGNFIGTDRSGTGDLANGGTGIFATSGRILVGGALPGAANTVRQAPQAAQAVQPPSQTIPQPEQHAEIPAKREQPQILQPQGPSTTRVELPPRKESSGTERPQTPSVTRVELPPRKELPGTQQPQVSSAASVNLPPLVEGPTGKKPESTPPAQISLPPRSQGASTTKLQPEKTKRGTAVTSTRPKTQLTPNQPPVTRREEASLARPKPQPPPPNQPPNADSQSLTVPENTPVSITLTASDPNGDSVTYRVVKPPTHGTLTGAAPNLIYKSRAKYNGHDSFTFKANDGKADSKIASIEVTIIPAPTRVAAVQQGESASDEAPIISPAPNVYGWNNASVTVTLKAKDNPGGSGIKEISYSLNGAQTGAGTAPGNSASMAISAEGTTTINYFARDNADNQQAPRTLTIRIDKTPPGLTCNPSPAPNLNGWNKTDVLVSFTASDSLSGVENMPSTVTVNMEGANQTITRTVTDRAGNSSKVSCQVSIDKTPPALTFGSPTPAANAAGWNNTNVSVPFTAKDSLSGVADTSPVGNVVLLSMEGSAVSSTVTVTDKAGNTAIFTSPMVKIDKTPPTLVFGVRKPAPNAAGWNNTDVSIPFTVADSLSGVASSSATSPLILAAEGPVVTGNITVTDLAGNSASFTSPVAKIDKTPPTLTFGSPSPPPNAAGWNNTNVSISFTAADGLSGVASTSVASPLVLTAEGQGVTGTVTVTDVAGNSATFTSPPVKIDKTAPR